MTSPDYDVAMERALKYLAPRARSCGEVAAYLRKSGHARESIERVLSRLEELSILDDRSYALEAASQGLAKGKGPDAVRRALASRGISDAVAGAAISDAFGATDGESLVLEAATRRAAKLRGLPLQAQQRRLEGYLVRRGHDPEIVHNVCRQVLEVFARSD